MREHLSESLEDWLTRSLYNLTVFEDRRVLVIGILGKESAEHSKSDPINAYLQNSVFLSTHSSSDSATAVDAFFASDISTVFLKLRGYGDVRSLESVFANQNGHKGFFECIADLEQDYVRYLTFLLTFSHVLLFIEPCCRFDMNVCRFLKKANELRLSTREEISVALGKETDFPREWVIEGRLARPRLLFCFHRSPLRTDLGAIKKKELVTKLEQSMENQIFNVLRLHKIIAHPTKSHNCASIPPDGTPFVYVFSAKEMPQDNIRDMIAYMVDTNEGKETEDDRKKRRDSEFGAFLKAHIDELRREPDKGVLYELPRLKWLLTGGKIIYDLIVRKELLTEEAVAELCNIELQFSKSMSGSYISVAKAAYTYRDSRDLEKRKPPMYSRREHQVKLERAIERLESIYHGSELDKAKEELIKECEAVWETQKACEMISLTGNECTLAIHSGPEDTSVPPVKRILHSSAARFLSTCTCGHTQALRNDPFTLKEANHDFYQHPAFGCCQRLERYKFSVFERDLNATEDTHESVSPEGNAPATLSSGDYVEYSAEDGEDDMEMLLDRDNRIERDDDDSGERRPSVDSPCKPASGSAVGEESNSDISELSDGVAEESLDDDEENADRTVRVGSRTQMRAHMDDYLDSAEENESAGGVEHTCYLDEDDVQLRERTDSDWDERSRSMAVQYAEQLTGMRNQFKGQFLECLPNSESPSVLPLFPSWSLVCLGPSSIYSHKAGLRDMPNFKNGSQFLLPWDVYLSVDSEKWDAEMKEIMSDSIAHRPRRPPKPGSYNREKVKLFVGYDYECPRGHRFIIENATTPMRAAAANSKESGAELMRSEVSLWMPCTCRRAPQVCAQLMRIHVVTPKAPVTVTIDPRVQPSDSSRETTFCTGEEPVKLEWAKYYVLRLPYVYAGPQGAVRRPNEPTVMGKLLPNCISVEYDPVE